MSKTDVIEYANREDMVGGLVEFRKDKNVSSVDVIGNGRSLRVTYVDDVNETQPPAHAQPLQRIDPGEAEQPEDLDPSADPEGEDETEQQAGESEQQGEQKDETFEEKIARLTFNEIEDGITDGSLDAEKVYAAENAGRKRKGVLTISGEGLLGK